MKIKITQEKLLRTSEEFEKIAETAIGLLLLSRMKTFSRNNALKINKVRAEVLAMQKEYLEFDGESIALKSLLIGMKKKPVFLEGKKEEDLEKDYDVIMKKMIEIEV